MMNLDFPDDTSALSLISIGEAPDDIEARAKQLDPNEGRCLVENNQRPVKACHVVSRDVSKDLKMMDSIEWYWKLKRYSLNLDSALNVFLSGLDIAHLYERKKWALIPSEYIVDKYFQSLQATSSGELEAVREKFPEITDEDGGYTYKFTPLADLSSVGIHRQLVCPPTSPEHIQTHIHPFATLPALRSHIHPSFVILELGRRLALLPPDIRAQLSIQKDSDLHKVQKIYRAWTELLPSYAKKDKGYNDLKKMREEDQDLFYPGTDSDGVDKGSIPRRLGYRPILEAIDGNETPRRKASPWGCGDGLFEENLVKLGGRKRVSESEVDDVEESDNEDEDWERDRASQIPAWNKLARKRWKQTLEETTGGMDVDK